MEEQLKMCVLGVKGNYLEAACMEDLVFEVYWL